jgi:hypothetical protein
MEQQKIRTHDAGYMIQDKKNQKPEISFQQSLFKSWAVNIPSLLWGEGWGEGGIFEI